MKQIGFIDYFLDEWHANTYPSLFEKHGFSVRYAYGEIDSPNGGMTSEEWAKEHNCELCKTIDELVEKSDYIVVLAPDNPETHVRLTEKALKSGKPVYIDKTFANSKEDAELIFSFAKVSETPCYSSSALYFSDEINSLAKNGIMRIDSFGAGNFYNYSIHQIEQIVKLMGYGAKRVMFVGTESNPALVIDYGDGRIAQIIHYTGASFMLNVAYDNGKSEHVKISSDFFGNCIGAMVEFFKTGIIPVPHEQTVEVAAIREAGLKSEKLPFTWIEV